MKKDIKFLFYSIVHPFVAFDGVKFENKGSVKLAILLAFVFFLQNVIHTVGSGFLFRTGDPDRVSVPMIFLVSMSIIILWIASNWGVGSLLDTEGKLREIIIVSTHALVPYIIGNLIITIASNFVTLDMAPFMNIFMTVCILWSVMVLVVGLFTINQVSFSGTFGIIMLTLFGMAVIVFLGVLAYSLFRQLYIFAHTLFSEIMFRL